MKESMDSILERKCWEFVKIPKGINDLKRK